MPAPDRVARAVVLTVAGLAAWNWYLDPSDVGRWAWAMVILPGIWAAIAIGRWWVLRPRAPRRQDDEAVRRYLDATLRFLALFIAMVGIAQAIALTFDLAGNLHLLEGRPFETRLLGLLSGTIFIVLGNGLPKILTPVSMLPAGGATRMSRMRRFIGASWVMVGVVVVAMFVFAPLHVAESARRWMVAAGVAAMVAGVLWLNLWPDRRTA